MVASRKSDAGAVVVGARDGDELTTDAATLAGAGTAGDRAGAGTGTLGTGAGDIGSSALGVARRNSRVLKSGNSVAKLSRSPSMGVTLQNRKAKRRGLNVAVCNRHGASLGGGTDACTAKRV